MSDTTISESDLTAIAAHLHVQLRRCTGRVTDVTWMVADSHYAQSIITLAKASSIPNETLELDKWTRRFERGLLMLKRPQQSLLSTFAAAAQKRSEKQITHTHYDAGQRNTHFSPSEFGHSVVSEFGDSSRHVNTGNMPLPELKKERYVFSLR